MGVKSYLGQIKDQQKTLNYYGPASTDSATVSSLRNRINNAIKQWQVYMNGGEYAANLVKRENVQADKVRLGRSAMSNRRYEAMAKSGVNKGAALRAVIIHNSWAVTKNDFGIPEYKSIGVDLAVKKEGKCFKAYGQIRKPYEGGGTYGDEYFSYWSFQKKMNCANVNR